MKRPTKNPTTVFLDPRQHQALLKLAAERDLSMGYLIRQAIALYLAKGAKV